MQLGYYQRKTAKKCCYCERPFTREIIASIDHFIPRSKGGQDCLDNIVISCKDCNHWKADLMPNDFKNVVDNYLQKNKTISFKTYNRVDLQNIVKNLELVCICKNVLSL